MAEDEDAHDRIERARRYLQDVQAGHVSMAHAEATAATLARYLGEVLAVVDDQFLCCPEPTAEQAARRDELLAEVPASQRAEGSPDIDCATAVATTLTRLPGGVITTVTQWLRAVRAEASQ